MDKKLTWKAKEARTPKKSSNWYWSVGIISVGAAVASVVAGNILLALLILLGGFAVMVAGSRPHTHRLCAISEEGFHIDANIIEWDKIEQFALKTGENPSLTLKTETLWGTILIPLSGVDFREVSMELKNRNIEEVDSLETFVEGITQFIGI